MNTLIVTLELRSALGTPLAADTLWGHLAWGVRYRHGAEALADWLRAYDGPNPPLVISDPLPSGFLPRPILPARPRPDSPPPLDQLDAEKRRGRIAWIPVEAWRPLAANVTPQAIARAIDGASLPDEPVESSVVHASINRLTGGTDQEGGGALFATPRWFFPSPITRFDVWVRTDMTSDALGAVFEDGLAGGYGRDAGGGCGWLKVAGVVQPPNFDVAGANAGVLLGMAVPRRGDPHRGWFGFSTRTGRLGGDFAIGPTPSGSTNRQKRPVHCLSRGSTLVAAAVPPIVGRLVHGVHEDPAIRHYGLSPVLPLHLEQPLLAEVSP